MQIGEFRVTRQRELAPELFVVEGELEPEPSEPVDAGHFLHLKVDDPRDYRMLWRPMSFLDYLPDANLAKVYYRVAGEGSYQLSKRDPGEVLPAIYPIGESFHTEDIQSAVFVAGGVGIAPLLMLFKELDAVRDDFKYTFLFGAGNREMLTPEWIAEWGVDATYTTEDDSLGHHGLVTDLLPEVLDSREWDMVYTCGPNPMMRAVQDLVPEGHPAQASMEAPMACAVGVCNGCNIPLTDRGMEWPVKTCVDGPVFDLHKIDFATIEESEGTVDRPAASPVG